MTKRTPIVAGNWKMNGTKESIRSLIEGIIAPIDTTSQTEVVVAPPSIFLPYVNELISQSSIQLAAQNVSEHDSGAFTGEIASHMLLAFACRFVIVGHSERRTYYAETSQIVANKFKSAQKASLIPILCVGETTEQRQSNQTINVVLDQINNVIQLVGINAFSQAVIAYEPIWAIGTGQTATPEQAQEVHQMIRQHLAKENDTIASQLQILYGGSMNAANANALFAQPDIDGGLVGGASLKVDEFIQICQAADHSSS